MINKSSNVGELFWDVFNCNHDAIIIIRLHDLITLKVNEPFVIKWGYKREDIIGNTSLNFDLWNKPKEWDGVYQKLKEEGEIKQIPAFLNSKNGDLIQSIISGKLLEIDSEECFIIFIKEITEHEGVASLSELENKTGQMNTASYDVYDHKIMKQTSKELEKKYSDLVEKVGFGIIEDDIEGNITYYNDHFLKIVGDIGRTKPINAIRSFVHPDDYDMVMQYHNKRVYGGSGLSKYECRFIRIDGEIIYIAVDVIPVYDGDKIIGTRSYLMDITGRKKIENELRESNLRNRIFAELTSDYVYKTKLSKKDGVIFEWIAGAVEKIIGYTKEEVLLFKDSWYKLIHPDDLPRYLDFYSKVLQNEELVIEYRLFHKNGKIVWIKDHMKPVWDENKQCIVNIYCAVQDISLQKKHEEELFEINEKLKSTLSSIDDLVFIFDKEGRFLEYPQKNNVEKLLLPPEVFIGKRFDKIGLDKTLVKNFKIAFNKVIKTGKTQLFDYKLKINKIQYGFNAKLSRRIDTSGNFAGITMVSRDITQRMKAEIQLKESKRILETLMGNLPGMAFRCLNNEGWSLIFISKGCKELTGYDPESFISGKNRLEFRDLVIHGYVKEDKMEVENALKEDRGYQVIYKLKTRNGAEKWVMERGKGVYDENGEIKFIEGFVIDISDRKKVEEALKTSEEKLKKVNDTKSKFFSIVAHDLKNPLNSIKQFLDYLLKDYYSFSEDEKKTFFEKIRKSLQISSDFLQNLLQWALSQTEQIDVNIKKINLSKLIDQNISLLRTTATNKNIAMTSIIDSDKIVYADKNMLNTIIVNLISNALKYTYKGGSVEISSRTIDGFEEICVTDNGMGISKEDIEKIFRIDQQYKGEGTEEETGTGIGLIVCKEFIEKFNGRIWVESDTGEGCKFYFTIPSKKG